MTKTAFMPLRRPFTVWRFESPCSGEIKVCARPSEPNEKHYEHAYQRILWCGMVERGEEALVSWRLSLPSETLAKGA